jgi:hypothetical protein
MKGLKYSVGILGGILLIMLAIPGMLFDFSGLDDQQYLSSVGYPPEMHADVLNALVADRIRILRIDTFRSLLFIILSAGLLWVYLKKKIKLVYIVTGLGLLILIDMWAVNKRYLNKDNFERRSVVENPFKPSVADNEIMRDREDGFRVLNLTVNPFSDAGTSYFHHSIGGYHGAKLRRYQELIDFQISPEISRIYDVLRTEADVSKLDGVFKGLTVINMLNTKYFIIMGSNGPVPVPNPYRLGAAWFVSDFQIVENADEEITSVGDINPAETLIADRKFAAYLEGKSFSADSAAGIELVDYKPNHLTYQSKAGSDQLAVFSEVYYPNGWTAYVDGEEVPYFRANWILRAMVVPAGEHTIEFKFQPGIYTTGERISLASSILLLLLVVVYAVAEVRKKL